MWKSRSGSSTAIIRLRWLKAPGDRRTPPSSPLTALSLSLSTTFVIFDISLILLNLHPSFSVGEIWYYLSPFVGHLFHWILLKILHSCNTISWLFMWETFKLTVRVLFIQLLLFFLLTGRGLNALFVLLTLLFVCLCRSLVKLGLWQFHP